MAGVTPAAKVSSSCKLLLMLLLCFIFLPLLFFAVVFYSFFSTLLFAPMLCVLTASVIFSEIVDRAPVWLRRRKWRNIFCSITRDDAQEYHAEKGKCDDIDHGKSDDIDHNQPALQERDTQDCTDRDPLGIPSFNNVSEEEEEEEKSDDDDDNDNEKISRSTRVHLQREEQLDRKGEHIGEQAGTFKKSDEDIQEGTKFIEMLSIWRSREGRNQCA